MFTDQRWMDLAPAFIRKTFIMRHPGYNVAYWNLAHREITRTASGEWLVNGERLVFFHFSGIAADKPEQFSKHQNRFFAHNLGIVADLCNDYRSRVLRNRWHQYSKTPYGFATFPDGKPIDDFMRHWVIRNVTNNRLPRHKALAVSSDYFNRVDEELAEAGRCLTRYMYQVWFERKDLSAAFDIHTDDGLARYYDWFIAADPVEQGFNAHSIVAARNLRGKNPATSPGTTTRVAPPWSPVSTELWCSHSSDVFQTMVSDCVFQLGGSTFRVPRQAALLWESRLDLQNAFNLSKPDGFQDYLCWVMTSAITDGSIDVGFLSADFIASLQRLSAITSYYRDVPITEGMIIFRHVSQARNFVPSWARFPVERSGRLSHGVWCAFVAPKLFGWPDEMMEPVRLYMQEQSETVVDGFRLSRASLALWELRPDLQRTFPLGDRLSVWRFLRWLLLDGLGELEVTPDEFDPRLRNFLSSSSPRHAGVSQLLEMIYDYRPDLQQNFDLATEDGLANFKRWAELEGGRVTEVEFLRDILESPPATSNVVHKASSVRRTALLLTGYWHAPSGRGEDLRVGAQALIANEFSDFLIFDLGSGSALDRNGTELPAGIAIEADANIVYTNPDTAFNDAQMLRRSRIACKRSIGFWAWELEYLPDYWRHAYSFYDEIWAATGFAEAAFRGEALRPVRLVRMAVTTPVAGADLSRRDLNLPEDRTVFLFMFDFRSFLMRKNPEAVVAAFMKAFPNGNEKAHLLIKTSGADAMPLAWDRLKDFASDPRIELRDAVLDRTVLLNLVQKSDAFVSLHRSEGFGRGPAEAMLLGVPTILTGYSGSDDYATPDCSLIVDYDLVKVGERDYPGVMGQRWAEANVSTAADHMRWIHENPDEARVLGARGRERIEALYNPRIVGKAMIEELGLRSFRKMGRAARKPTRKQSHSYPQLVHAGSSQIS